MLTQFIDSYICISLRGDELKGIVNVEQKDINIINYFNISYVSKQNS